MIKTFRYNEKSNILYILLKRIFWHEYFSKLKNPEEIRKITDSTLDDGQGRKWAEYYFGRYSRTYENLHNPIFSEIAKYIKNNHLSEDKNTFIIQIGSSSGRDLKFFYDQFPKLNYISTDINDEILNFQKEKYDFPNFKFFKCHADDIDKCFKQFNLEAKRIILFSIGSVQYVQPYFLKLFFSKIRLHKNLIYFLSETVVIKLIKNSWRVSSGHRSQISFSHNYEQLAQKNNLKIIKKQTIHLQSKDDPVRRHTIDAMYYCCCKTN